MRTTRAMLAPALAAEKLLDYWIGLQTTDPSGCELPVKVAKDCLLSSWRQSILSAARTYAEQHAW